MPPSKLAKAHNLTKSGSNEGLLDEILSAIQKGTFFTHRASKTKPTTEQQNQNQQKSDI